MQNINWQKFVPHLLIVLGFLAITYSTLSPILQGKQLYQSDIVQSYGVNSEINDYREKQGKQILWTNRPFAGMPSFMVSTKYKNNVLRFVEEYVFLPLSGTHRAAKILFSMMLAFYLGALLFGVNKWLSAIGAAAFGLSTFLLLSLEAGHNAKLVTIAYMAPIIASIIYAYRKNALWGAIWLAIWLGLSINGNHIQITYYCFLVGLIIFVNELIYYLKSGASKNFIQTTAYLVLAAIFAVGLNANRMYTTYQHSKETTRGGTSVLKSNKKNESSGLDYQYATAWSYGPKESFTLIIPNFAGGASGGSLSENSETYKTLKGKMPKSQAQKTIKRLPLYYGKQSFTGGPTYVGAVICFLFLLALFIIPGRMRWWIIGATLLSLFLAWGKYSPIFSVFFDYFPLFNKFRAPSMALTIICFLFPLVAILGLDKIFKESFDKEKLKRALLLSVGITGGMCLISAILGGGFWSFEAASDGSLPNWLVDSIVSDRKALLRNDAFRSLVLIALTFGLLWFFLKEKLNSKILIPALAILIVGDLFFVGKRYITKEDFVKKRDIERTLKPDFNDAMLAKDKSQFRMWNTNKALDKDGVSCYKYNSLSGYSAAKLLLYQDLIDAQLSQGNQRVANMLNTKYLIRDGEATRNVGACGNAWFAQNILWEDSPQGAMQAMKSFDPCKDVIIDNSLKSTIGNLKPAPSGTISLVKNKGDELEYSATTVGNQLAVFSEIFYDAGGGWKAWIDGKPAEVLKVNYALRGLIVPNGSKKIEFKFQPNFYRIGELISLIFSILFVAVLGWFVYNWLKNNENKGIVAKEAS